MLAQRMPFPWRAAKSMKYQAAGRTSGIKVRFGETSSHEIAQTPFCCGRRRLLHNILRLDIRELAVGHRPKQALRGGRRLELRVFGQNAQCWRQPVPSWQEGANLLANNSHRVDRHD
jgi:hypothetical protein